MKIYDYNGKKNICGERIREARLKQRLSQSDLKCVNYFLIAIDKYTSNVYNRQCKEGRT